MVLLNVTSVTEATYKNSFKFIASIFDKGAVATFFDDIPFSGPLNTTKLIDHQLCNPEAIYNKFFKPLFKVIINTVVQFADA